MNLRNRLGESQGVYRLVGEFVSSWPRKHWVCPKSYRFWWKVPPRAKAAAVLRSWNFPGLELIVKWVENCAEFGDFRVKVSTQKAGKALLEVGGNHLSIQENHEEVQGLRPGAAVFNPSLSG